MFLVATRGLKLRRPTMCSVCARAGEEKETQKQCVWGTKHFRGHRTGRPCSAKILD